MVDRPQGEVGMCRSLTFFHLKVRPIIGYRIDPLGQEVDIYLPQTVRLIPHDVGTFTGSSFFYLGGNQLSSDNGETVQAALERKIFLLS